MASLASGDFHFISIRDPDETKDKKKRQLARSHAVKQALEKKRKQQQKSKTNFRVCTSRATTTISPSNNLVGASLLFQSPSSGTLDPFSIFAVDLSRLQILLCDSRARQAPEPVFSIAEGLAFQNFHSVFRTSTGFEDPALLNAVMLSLAFAVAGGSIDGECLRYQSQAISYIRERISSLGDAAMEATIGAILLLAGVEARLGMVPQVQLHMGAVQQLLEICRRDGIYLTSGIKRAIFWQDLNSSILAQTPRLYSHTTFSELHWARDPFVPKFYHLPSGFQALSSHLTPELINILEDLHALQCIREVPYYSKSDMTFMTHINNHTASIQSRLMDLPRTSVLQECCILTAYNCSIMLCCTAWCALIVPSHISSKLLHILQQTSNDQDTLWDDHPKFLLWLLYIGGAFAPEGKVRSGFIALLRANNASRFAGWDLSWQGVVEILKEFVWSEKAFGVAVRGVWEEVLG
ncbi:hypothetical protein BJY04DRAFT_24647 [Aspergillus karnatakaensis]|uniref:uncharacterized protein n=1 Tax=Aspergillus karnatakaensis TaxID=1810916 RepID=UPI003CCE479C